MPKITDLTTTAGNDEFYPTPDVLIEKMLEGLDYRMIGSVLEPSAGKGDLLRGFFHHRWKVERYDVGEISVDFCELDPYLRQICIYNFSEDIKREIRSELESLRGAYSSLTEEQRQRREALEEQLRKMEPYDSVRVVHDDFLTYRTAKHYDLILMNPPFSQGDKHLLKALSMQERGGAIICLLNAETIQNPYTASRQMLLHKLQKYGAQIEYVEDAFAAAERSARVDVAIVRVNIPQPEEHSDIWERMKKAEEENSVPDPELEALVSGDYIEQAIQLYRTEVAATLELARQYKALVPYMASSLDSESYNAKDPILELRVGDKDFSVNRYLRTVRLKYWTALFNNKKFIGRLTSNLRQDFQARVDKMADYEFSAFNIRQVALEMNDAMRKGVEDEILKLFDELSAEHSWYPECSQNRHYYNGWATNKAHKIGKKVILPTNLKSYSWSKDAFDLYVATNYLSDIEKTLDYLDAKPMSDGAALDRRLRMAFDDHQTRNIRLRYFDVDIFKKGTVHIKFLPSAMPIVERLNIYASRKKNWLPPNYGKASYSNMDKAEKEVVDSFHGDGTDGSGAEAYAEVLQKSDFYLSEPVKTQLALGA